MTDYQISNGNIQMMIRDTGGSVEFWVLTGRSTYNHQQTYSYEVDGVGSSVLQFDMNARGSWQRVTTVYPSYRQNVRFTMYNTGLGFPTRDFWQWIERARRPDPPGAPYFAEITQDTIHTAFNFGYDGGMAIDAAQIWVSDDPNSIKWLIDNTYDHYVDNLQSRIWYYFWGRTHNPLGWSDFGPRSQARTDGVPDAPTTPQLTNLADSSVHVNYDFTGWDGGTPILEWQVAYGTDPDTPQSFQSGVNIDISGLLPNTTYYFWGRGRNALGWGFYSARASVKTLGPPAAPSSVDLSSPTATTVKVSFEVNADNGKPIDAYQIGYSKTSDAPTDYFDLADVSGTVTDLEPGTLYYFWARAHNEYGWGAPSLVAKTAQTTAGAWINVAGVWRQAVPYVKVDGVWQPAQVWAKIAGVWKATI